DDRVVAEDAPLPPAANRWAHYQRSKLAAEQEATRAAEAAHVGLTIVRPGILFGPGKPLKTGLVRLGGTRVSIGRGRNHLPVTDVDNVVDALLLALASDAAIGATFNVVDEPQ